MPWWSWILVWLLLVLVLFGVMALGAVHLWRRASGLLKEVGAAQESLSSAYDASAEPLRFEAERHGVPVGWDAAFADPAEVRAAKESERDGRVAARRDRRIASLYAHGRPRRWGDVVEDGRDEA